MGAVAVLGIKLDKYVVNGQDKPVNPAHDDLDNFEVERNMRDGLERTFTPDGISDGQLIPDETQSELISIRDKQTQDCFRIGDIANMMVVRAAEAGFRVPAWRVRRAVGRFAGKSERTVRYYAEVAAWYDDEARERFSILPFSHFVFARTFGPRWLEVLDYSMLKPEVTVDELRREFVGKIHSDADHSQGGESGEDGYEQQLRDFDPDMCEYSQVLEIAPELAPTGNSGSARSTVINACGDLLAALGRADEAFEGIEMPSDFLREYANLSIDLRNLISNAVRNIV